MIGTCLRSKLEEELLEELRSIERSCETHAMVFFEFAVSGKNAELSDRARQLNADRDRKMLSRFRNVQNLIFLMLDLSL